MRRLSTEMLIYIHCEDHGLATVTQPGHKLLRFPSEKRALFRNILLEFSLAGCQSGPACVTQQWNKPCHSVWCLSTDWNNVWMTRIWSDSSPSSMNANQDWTARQEFHQTVVCRAVITAANFAFVNSTLNVWRGQRQSILQTSTWKLWKILNSLPSYWNCPSSFDHSHACIHTLGAEAYSHMLIRKTPRGFQD